MVMWVHISQTELIIEICSTGLIRAIANVLLMKIKTGRSSGVLEVALKKQLKKEKNGLEHPKNTLKVMKNGLCL